MFMVHTQRVEYFVHDVDVFIRTFLDFTRSVACDLREIHSWFIITDCLRFPSHSRPGTSVRVLVIKGDPNRRFTVFIYTDKPDAWNLFLNAFYDDLYLRFPIMLDVIVCPAKKGISQLQRLS